jgi:hypothetical protein
MMTTVTDVTESIHAANNLQDVVQLIAELRRNKEPLLHTAVFIDLKAESEEKLRELQSDIRTLRSISSTPEKICWITYQSRMVII